MVLEVCKGSKGRARRGLGLFGPAFQYGLAVHFNNSRPGPMRAQEDPQDRNPEALTAEVSIIEETVSEEESESQWSDGWRKGYCCERLKWEST